MKAGDCKLRSCTLPRSAVGTKAGHARSSGDEGLALRLEEIAKQVEKLFKAMVK